VSGHAARIACSPAELLREFLLGFVDPAIVPAGVVVGGADDTEQQAGVISLMDAGSADTDSSGHLLHKRIQVRCMGPTLEVADEIGNHADSLLDDQERIEVSDTNGRRWLIHQISVSVGSSHHIDSAETWESLLFARVTVGRSPIPAA